ncbi:MAG: hypothetical protein ABJN34_01055 [Litoreibacter sp.]|uniref:hypothetical protein n=1 Tax=Litoreibacter sp. TaxID=1969459 RepID=UPI0032980FAA
MHKHFQTKFALSFLLAMSVGVGAGFSQEERIPQDKIGAFDFASPMVSRRGGLDGVREQMLQTWSRADLDAIPGIQELDLELAHQITEAKSRSSKLSNYLQYDLDADGKVSRSEMSAFAYKQAGRFLRSGNVVIEPTSEQRAQVYENALEKFMEPDTNGDGMIVVSEIIATLLQNRQTREPFNLMRFDNNSDGTVDRGEILAAFEQFKSLVDQNDDDQLDPAELELIQKLTRERRQRQARPNNQSTDRLLRQLTRKPRAQLPKSRDPFQTQGGPIPVGCQAPTPRDWGEIYAIAGYEGAAMSNLKIGRSSTTTTSVVDVKIPEGDGAMTLYASFYSPTVLRFSGATKRLKHVVTDFNAVISASSRARISLVKLDESCRQNTWPARSEPVPSVAPFVHNLFRHTVVGSVQAYTVGTVDLSTLSNDATSLFTGAKPTDDQGKYKAFWEQVLRNNPGGVLDLRNTRLQSNTFNDIYPLMPQMAGMITLMEQGAITAGPRPPIRDIVMEHQPGSVRLAGKNFTPRGGDDLITVGSLMYTEEEPGKWVARSAQQYLANRKFNLPTGLLGAHSAFEIVLPEGIPAPLGTDTVSIVHGVDNFASGTRSR